MSEVPRSPRQRILQEDMEAASPSGVDVQADPTMSARAAAEAARDEAIGRAGVGVDPHAMSEENPFPDADPDTWLPGDEVPPPESESAPFDPPYGPAPSTPPVLLLGELEHIIEGLAGTQYGDFLQAADYLQGMAVVLGIGYEGEVQMLVLRGLQLYREITTRRQPG